MEEALVSKLREENGELGGALDTIAQAARTEHGRRSLSSLGTVPLILSKFQVCVQDVESPFVVQLLRALRNLCAGEVRNQDAFVEGSGVELVASLVGRYQAVLVKRELDKVCMDAVKVALQLLGNVAGRGEHARGTVWESLFPDLLVDLACVTSGDVHEPLSMVLYTCCKTNEERRVQACQGKGARLLALLLRDSECEAETNNQWLSMLLEDMCFKDEHFPLLFRSIGAAVDEEAFTSEHAALLNIVCSVVDERQEAGEKIGMPRKSVSFLVDVIHRAALKLSVITEKCTSWPTGSPTPDVLGFGLSLVRLLYSHEDAPVDDMLRLLGTCLRMLARLGPPDMVKKALKMEATSEKTDDETTDDSGSFPVHNVYRGYRRDIVAVIANMSFRNVRVQDAVRASGGLLLVLQQCVVDKDNPFLREWGLWAIRNLTEGNPDNVEELRTLELKKVVNTEEILEAGLKLEADVKNKTLKLNKV